MNDDITLPTHSEWKHIPGSPFEVITYLHEQIGTVHLRYNEAHAEQWLDRMLEKRAARIEEEARQWAQGKARYDD